jgi:glutamine amidotransferase
MIAIVDYGMGNLRSVEKGFLKVGVNAKITSNSDEIMDADGVVLPGVGAFRDCMRELTNLSLVDTIVDSIKKGKPYLGICLGLQVLFSESEEFGRCRGLDILRGKVKKFQVSSFKQQGAESATLKVPHMGWNQIRIKKDNPLLRGIEDNAYFYFVHSYYVVPDDESIISTITDYGIEFTSMIWQDNIYAVQFHPEKSQRVGLWMLKNFGNIVKALD